MRFYQDEELQYLQYNIQVINCTISTSIPIDAHLNSWVAHNQGNVWALVNGKLIKGYPVGHPELEGGAYGPTGNFGEIYRGRIDVLFSPNLANSGTTDPLISVVLKFYVI